MKQVKGKRAQPKTSGVMPERSWRLADLEQCARDYCAGDKTALAHTIAICAKHGVALPNWASDAYVTGYRNIANFHSKTWDSIFGTPVPKGKQLSALRKRRQKAFLIWNEIQYLHERGRSIDNDLFDEIGEKFGVGATVAKEYYYAEQLVAEHAKGQLELQEEWVRLQAHVTHTFLEAGDLEKARRLINLIEEICGSRPR